MTLRHRDFPHTRAGACIRVPPYGSVTSVKASLIYRYIERVISLVFSVSCTLVQKNVRDDVSRYSAWKCVFLSRYGVRVYKVLWVLLWVRRGLPGRSVRAGASWGVAENRSQRRLVNSCVAEQRGGAHA